MLKAKRAERIRTGEKNSWIEIVLDEGKNRQIRRMLEAASVEVLRLIRVAIGPVELAAGKRTGARIDGEREGPIGSRSEPCGVASRAAKLQQIRNSGVQESPNSGESFESVKLPWFEGLCSSIKTG